MSPSWLIDDDCYGLLDPATATALDCHGVGAAAFHGTVPAHLATYTALEQLLLQDNGLGGPIPAAFNGLTALRQTANGQDFMFCILDFH